MDSYERSLKDIERFPDSVGVATVAAIHFACSGDELVCVIGGTVQDYIYFNGATSLYWGMMLHALNNGYSRYNFYGTFGISRPGRDRPRRIRIQEGLRRRGSPVGGRFRSTREPRSSSTATARSGSSQGPPRQFWDDCPLRNCR